MLERALLNHVQYSRVLRARVYNVQTRQEITLALSSWQHPSRDSIARPHRHCGRSTHRSRVHRTFLGARYASRSCERKPTHRSPSSDVWTVSDLIERVGPLERSAALKGLLAWVDRGVLREESDDANVQRFRLLESAPADASSVLAGVGVMTAGSRAALTEEQPAVLTVQQQQAEQMKVYWKVRVALSGIGAMLSARMAIASSSRACSQTWVGFHWTAFRRCSSLRRGMTARWTSWARSWTPPVARVLSTLRTASGGSTDNELTAGFALL
jgi:hypothetical protein